MTHTRIIAADGTRYIPQGEGRRLVKRIIAGIAISLALIIATAAVIGFYRAMTAPTPPPATSTETFNDGWNTGLTDLQDIAHRAGEVKVGHCLSSTTTPDDLYACLTRK